jgi:hypothetical protein
LKIRPSITGSNMLHNPFPMPYRKWSDLLTYFYYRPPLHVKL